MSIPYIRIKASITGWPPLVVTGLLKELVTTLTCIPGSMRMPLVLLARLVVITKVGMFFIAPINPRSQQCLRLTKREGVRILSLFIETKASPNAHPKNESNKYSPRLYRNMRIQHGHPLNVYDKVSVFVYFLVGI